MTIPPPPLPPVPPEEPATADAPAKGPSWWRSNTLALVALAALLPATAVAVGWQEWYQYFGFGARAVTAVVVPEDGTTDLAGAAWGPVRGGEIEDVSGLDVPEHTRLIAVALPVDPSTEGIGCETPSLVEQSTGREWSPVRAEIGLDWSADEPETCLSEQSGAYELIVPFVVPDDVEGPFWVDVRPYDAGGSFVRFEFEP
ncbi:hypothetical protein [Microbacterium sp. MYb66]|uniref:hypothetical protein n=1 Tax=Microbacterium sp. MYb66 TaxID=1848692 RepID=UPI000CFF7481|nr:hypothetical protein [Microbacterium sp. MYb66]PRA80295.1 hypothetical protein CQ045_11765 [Microbacterium sp. MYb66]